MSLLCESLSEIDEIPSSLLSLSKEKADSMSSILGTLIEKTGKSRKAEVQPQEARKEEERVEKKAESPKSHETKEEPLEKKAQVLDDFSKGKEDKTEINSNFGTIVVDEKKEERTEPKAVKSDEKEKTEVVASEKQISSVRIPKKKLSAESRFVKSLKLCLGDKFRYKKELFNDDMELLNVTMSELDKLTSLEEAFAYVERFGWNEENPAVEDFFDLLQSRFS
ncbi:MAG: hypothetical protein IJJ77_04370 [Paludibacteraceae bacterium]|nr:hypothetical protein [Paludibacteraceae bacterium]